MHPHLRIGVGRPPPPPPPARRAQPPAPAPASASIDRSRVRPRNSSSGSSSSSNRFARPPQDPAGILLDASDRPLLCCSLHQQQQGRECELVVGSADHALYCYDVRSGRATRRLYGARHGHIDWVAAVAHLPDGRILSGGGDGKLCLWPRASTTSSTSTHSSTNTNVPCATCQDLDGHASAVSKVAAVPESARLAFSAGYDGTVKLWDTITRRLLTCLDAGRPSPNALDPVVDFAFGAAHLLSGTRRGSVHLWDLASGALLSSIRAAHQGQVTCVIPLAGDTTAAGGAAAPSAFATGGQDGRVRIWDTRSQAPSYMHTIECHADAARGTTAAVACLEAAGPLLCTGGADGRVCVLDSRTGFRPAQAFDHHRGAPVCALKATGGVGGEGGSVLFSGGGDGMLLAYDLGAMALCYGLHANQGAVRCVAASEELDTVMAAGDDGKALLYRY